MISLTATAQPGKVATYPLAAVDAFRLLHVQTNRNSGLQLSSSSKQLFLFVFLSPECPLCQQYSLNLNQIASQYREDVAIMGIIPGRSYDTKTIQAFIKKYRISFPVYIDSKKEASNYLEASVTPEVVLLEKENGTLRRLYSGAIDDKVQSLKVKKLEASNDYARNAIALTLQKKEILISRTEPVGCLINDY